MCWQVSEIIVPPLHIIKQNITVSYMSHTCFVGGVKKMHYKQGIKTSYFSQRCWLKTMG